MKKRIVFATGNAGKMKEIKMILGDLGMPVVSMKEAGIEADIVEDGTSFAENAQIKASAVFEKCHDIVLADDYQVRHERPSWTDHIWFVA